MNEGKKAKVKGQKWSLKIPLLILIVSFGLFVGWMNVTSGHFKFEECGCGIVYDVDRVYVMNPCPGGEAPPLCSPDLYKGLFLLLERIDFKK
jgi:hypothetical protein